METVKNKYNRRIIRFYDAMKQPCLLIRYVNTEEEAAFWQANYRQQLDFYQSYCSENQLLLVVDDRWDCGQNDFIYYVACDFGDTVARRFCEKNAALLHFLSSDAVYDSEKRMQNLHVYQKSQRRKNSLLSKVKRKLQFKKRFNYIHENRI